MTSAADDIGTSEMKSVVLVERQLQAELMMTEKLKDISVQLAGVLGVSDPGGLQPEKLSQLQQMTSEFSVEAARVRIRRAELMKRINEKGEAPPSSIRTFIGQCSPVNAKRLDELRKRTLNVLNEIQALVAGNQAVFFYSLDFHKKMVNGLLNFDSEDGNYGSGGQTPGFPPGNLLRKAC